MLYFKLHPPRFDGYALQFGVEWSEQPEPWQSVFGSTILVAGWIGDDGVPVFEAARLETALKAEESRVQAHVDAQRTPAVMPDELAAVVRTPMTRATLTERIQTARQSREAGPAKGTAG